ncbi:hypothetical protein FACS18948_0230 [Clostridia bacterium]|nr:hypothetical protein FACS18948_0230 [Clostridia bacterium]
MINEIRDIIKSYDNPSARLEETRSLWRVRLSAVTVKTPNHILNRMLNEWLPYQTTVSRLWARAGFYQAGGAIGFRDQLQDMLVLLDTRPDEVRAHILNCAAHQFVAGDVMHWWHPPMRGVRTRLTDDRLFLPYITALYIKRSGDLAILNVKRPFACGLPIPDGKDDLYSESTETGVTEALHEHCLRALDSIELSERGIPLIGGGDWNDALSHVGHNGRGESVWLGWFYAVCLRIFAEYCDDKTAKRLLDKSGAIIKSVEEHAWDGDWYRRATFDDGCPIGSADNRECQIDAIAQSWAAIAGADTSRSIKAVNSAMERLYDADNGILRLLDPPFATLPTHRAGSEGQNADDARNPGYIRGYLPGIRENGGQYTHGAAWMVMALAELGDTERAWTLYESLLPSSHSNTPENAAAYRVEPYVVAADIYTNPQQYGRGGWTWYTGAAAWMYHIGLRVLLGFDKDGQRIRLSTSRNGKIALGATVPSGWERYEIVYRYGRATYRLQARRDQEFITFDGGVIPKDSEGWVNLIDDGKDHLAVYTLR